MEVAYKTCETCGNYELRFCARCGAEVEHPNRCGDCNRFVKTTSCPDCGGCGIEEEYVEGGDFGFYVGEFSNKEHRKFVSFSGTKGKVYKAKVIKVLDDHTIRIRVKGKELVVHTHDL